MRKLNPAGQEKMVVKRFARESVYLPKRELVLLGYHLEGEVARKNQVPFYDVANNRWLTAELKGSEFFSRQGTGASVDLGLIYDAPRDVVWAVMCRLQGPQDLQAIRLNEELSLSPIE